MPRWPLWRTGDRDRGSDVAIVAVPPDHHRWPRRLLGYALIRKARIEALLDVGFDQSIDYRSIELPQAGHVVASDPTLGFADVASQLTNPLVRLHGTVFRQPQARTSAPHRQSSRWRRWLGVATSSQSDNPPDLQLLVPFLINHQLIARSYGPLVLPHPLYPFQRDGIDFLIKRKPGALLADDMGLGKTVQAIIALRMLFYNEEIERALVVAPKSVLTSWMYHFREWAPTLNVANAQGSVNERRRVWREFSIGKIDVCLVSYDTLRRDFASVDRLAPEIGVLVADEVQQIKNPSTQRTQALRNLSARRRWGMSGTPLENSVDEFAAVLHFLDRGAPDALNVRRSRRGRRRSEDIAKERGLHAARVKSTAGRMMLRRRKRQVLHQLPSLVSNAQYIALTEMQRQAYELAESSGVDHLRGQPRDITNILTLIHTLKRICNGVDGYSAKLEWLIEYIETASSRGEKVLVFSQYTRTLPEEVKAYFPLKYDGSLSGARRDAVVDAFTRDREATALLVSTRAGGLGLNLQAANHVVHFDSWWNPAVQQQATARAHRLGQTRTVFESTLVSTGTIEERIQTLLTQKQRLFDRVVDELSVEGVARQLTVDELYNLFERHGC